MTRETHAIVTLEISQTAYDEIAEKLIEAGYEHVFAADVMDMQGIGLQREPDRSDSSLTDSVKSPPLRLVEE